MKGTASRNIAPAEKDGAERRTVPGPRSKALFDREAEVMAPGLQSIALYSQIARKAAQFMTSMVTNISISSPASRSAASATVTRTT